MKDGTDTLWFVFKFIFSFRTSVGGIVVVVVVVDRKYKKINMIVDESTHRHNLQYVI